LQLKCTEKPAPKSPLFNFSIKLKNYDDLRDTDIMVPRILVVLYVPKLTEDWLNCTESELTLKRCAFWVNLDGLPESSNGKSQTIQMVRAQLFTVEALSAIMKRIGEGHKP
jgi:hypothetical protein